MINIRLAIGAVLLILNLGALSATYVKGHGDGVSAVRAEWARADEVRTRNEAARAAALQKQADDIASSQVAANGKVATHNADILQQSKDKPVATGTHTQSKRKPGNRGPVVLDAGWLSGTLGNLK